jgi:sporulation protein YlmC with PRC-barrel domain
MSALAPSNNDESHEDTLADLFGLEVYTVSGVYVGRVEDARVDFGMKKASGLALKDVNPDVVPQNHDLRKNRGILVPYRWIHSSGDVVIVSDVFERLKQAGSASESPLAHE